MSWVTDLVFGYGEPKSELVRQKDGSYICYAWTETYDRDGAFISKTEKMPVSKIYYEV